MIVMHSVGHQQPPVACKDPVLGLFCHLAGHALDLTPGLDHFIANRIQRLLPIDFGRGSRVAQFGGFGLDHLSRLGLLALD